MVLLMTLLELFTTVLADISGSEYDVNYGCDLTYGNVLETLNNIRSVTECSEQCNEDNQCLSVKYDQVNNVCQLNSQRYPLLSEICQSIFRYAKLTKRSGIKLINEGCDQSPECTVLNSQCYLNKCQCVPGYSYNNIEESCVTSCGATYGSKFTAYPGRYIGGKEDKLVYNIDTGDVCERACAEETSFVCLSVDYNTASRICGLTTATALTANLYTDEVVIYYHRDC